MVMHIERMTEEDFQKVVEKQLDSCKQILLVKAKEYRRNNNPFHNFEAGSKMTNQSREKVLFGFLLKHLVSLQDIREDLDRGLVPSEALLDEKYTDVINYLLLEKAMITNTLQNRQYLKTEL